MEGTEVLTPSPPASSHSKVTAASRRCGQIQPLLTSGPAVSPKPLGTGQLHRDDPTQGHTFRTEIGKCPRREHGCEAGRRRARGAAPTAGSPGSPSRPSPATPRSCRRPCWARGAGVAGGWEWEGWEIPGSGNPSAGPQFSHLSKGRRKGLEQLEMRAFVIF